MEGKLDIKDFDVSETTGFAFGDALEALPEYFQPWNDLAKRIADLMKNKTVREEVIKLPLLDHTKLSGQGEHHLAHIQLSYFVGGYVWQNGKDDVAKVLPRCVAVPYYGLCETLTLPPVISYVDMTLANWRLIDPERPLTAANIRLIVKAPGGTQIRAFLGQTVEIEATFAPAIQHIIDAVEAAKNEDNVSLTRYLDDISGVMKTITGMLHNYHDLTTPEVFYFEFLPFLHGWGPNTPLPEGLVFEGVKDEPLNAGSCSAAETSTMQLMDAALSVQHSEGTRTAFDGHRRHMPAKHRQLIETIEKRSNIRQYVTSCNDEALTSSFEGCIRSVVDFRSKHIQMVTKFVIGVAKNDPSVEPLIPYLKASRDETLKTG